MSVTSGQAPIARRGRPPGGGGGPAPARVESVERALSVLEAFADGTSRLTLAELSRRTGLYPSTLLRLAASLERFGHLSRGEDGLFRLGPATLRLGTLYRAGFDLAAHVRPALARLVAATGETAAFYVREGERRVVLFREEPARAIRFSLAEGAVLPLERGAAGAVLRAGGALAHAVSLGERDPELAAVAAPVFGEGGRFLGALGISGPLARFEGATQAALLAAVLAEAAALTGRLRG
jgi:DNA-binding IclR family transcriptional regulator